jgi:hypothetical protein
LDAVKVVVLLAKQNASALSSQRATRHRARIFLNAMRADTGMRDTTAVITMLSSKLFWSLASASKSTVIYAATSPTPREDVPSATVAVVVRRVSHIFEHADLVLDIVETLANSPGLVRARSP